MANALYYGDNLAVLRESIGAETADLIYLDPPFNSNASYNVLFKAPSGKQSQAQIEAFEDTWHWTANDSADGIDGYYYCKPDGKKTEVGIVSVKGGETVHRNAVGELRGVMEREKAPLAVMITLREPTAPMIREAASAGFFNTPFGRFPKMHVVSVAKLLEGKLPKLPPQERGGGYRRAEREEAMQERLL